MHSNKCYSLKKTPGEDKYIFNSAAIAQIF